MINHIQCTNYSYLQIPLLFLGAYPSFINPKNLFFKFPNESRDYFRHALNLVGARKSIRYFIMEINWIGGKKQGFALPKNGSTFLKSRRRGKQFKRTTWYVH